MRALKIFFIIRRLEITGFRIGPWRVKGLMENDFPLNTFQKGIEKTLAELYEKVYCIAPNKKVMEYMARNYRAGKWNLLPDCIRTALEREARKQREKFLGYLVRIDEVLAR